MDVEIGKLYEDNYFIVRVIDVEKFTTTMVYTCIIEKVKRKDIFAGVKGVKSNLYEEDFLRFDPVSGFIGNIMQEYKI